MRGVVETPHVDRDCSWPFSDMLPVATVEEWVPRNFVHPIVTDPSFGFTAEPEIKKDMALNTCTRITDTNIDYN